MNITKKWLKEKDACKDGIKWFISQTETDCISLVEKLININIDWANWLIIGILNKKQCIEYAIFAAEKVLHIFEEKYLEEKRPRLAVESAKSVLKHNTKKNRDVAKVAGNAVYVANVPYSYLFACTAYTACHDNYGACAYSTYSASYVNYSAPYVAKKEILLKGIEIYKKSVVEDKKHNKTL
jgi:hypothetical protein